MAPAPLHSSESGVQRALDDPEQDGYGRYIGTRTGFSGARLGHPWTPIGTDGDRQPRIIWRCRCGAIEPALS